MSFGATAPPVVNVVKQKLYDFTNVAFDVKHYQPGCPDLPTSEPSSPQDTYTVHIPKGQDPTGKVVGWACVMHVVAEVHLTPCDGYYCGNTMVYKAVKNGQEFPARSTGTHKFGIDFVAAVSARFGCNVKEGDVIGAKVWRGDTYSNAPINLVFVSYELVPVSFSITGLVQFYWDGSIEGKTASENCQHEEIGYPPDIYYGVLGPDVTMLGGEVVTFEDMYLSSYDKLSPICMAVTKMQFNQDDGFYNTAGLSYITTEAYPIKIAALTVED